MRPERWQEVERIYHGAAPLPLEERALFLDRQCAGDVELRAEVQRMLAVEAEDGGFLHGPAIEVAARDLAAAEPVTPGSRFGPYEIVSLLGKGGMGEVYEARDTRLNRTVAIKLLPAFGAGDPERRRRFLREARAASALNHPNIVTLHDILSEGGHDVLVMEYLEGRTLEEKIAGKGLPLPEALHYSIQIAEALATAHAAGIVHRDLKPGNIVITGENSGLGRVKVLDFGLAKFTGGESETEPAQTMETGDGRILGTVAYMSPEQAEGRKVDARSDIFSFGVLLYEMVTGVKAFLRGSTTSTLAAILRDEFEPVESIPESFRSLLGRCLKKDPTERAQSMAEIKLSLEEIREKKERAPAQLRTLARRWWKWASLAAGVTALAAAGWLVIGRSRSTEPPLVVKPVTSYPGKALSPAFSPDGNQVAFSWNGDKQDNYDIYVKFVDSGAPLRLTTNPAVDQWPSWSPDGKQIAFLRGSNPRKGELLLISPLGGVERKLADFRDATSVPWWGTPAWTSDNKFLLVRDESAIVLVSVETGEKRRFTFPPAGWEGDCCPSLSPDGRTLAFARMRVHPIANIFLAPVADGTRPWQLTHDDRRIEGLTWTPDGKEIVFSSNRTGDSTLWRISASGGRPERLPVAGTDAVYPAIARQGQRVAFTQQTYRSSFWKLDLSPEGLRRPPIRLMTSSRSAGCPVLSPDGGHIAFLSDRSGIQEEWVCDSQGANAVQLTFLQGILGCPYWSPDSRNIVFAANTKDRRLLYVIAASGGKPRQLSSEEVSTPSWSRDGRWIYFVSNRTGTSQTWKIPAEGGNIVQLTKGGGGPGIESMDGKYFYYQRTADDELRKVPAEGGEETLVTKELYLFNRWAMGNEGLYFAQPRGREHQMIVKFFRFDTGESSQIAALDQPFPSSQTRLSLFPDGRWLLYDQTDRDESDIMLIENFR